MVSDQKADRYNGCLIRWVVINHDEPTSVDSETKAAEKKKKKISLLQTRRKTFPENCSSTSTTNLTDGDVEV